MKIHNFIPTLVEALARWERPPSVDEFAERYHAPMGELVSEAMGDAADMHGLLEDLDWPAYRRTALRLDPVREEERVRRHLGDVERLMGFPLEGEIVLFGGFGALDGYARFDRGTHRVFLGIDDCPESTGGGRGEYLDVLEVHELTHVARESRPDVWSGWGLNPRMTHDEFSEYQPVIEHVFGEGFSCAVSELLVPGVERWHYAYQETEAALSRVLENGAAVDRAIQREIHLGEKGDWSRLYSPGSYQPRLPVFTHYVWGWKWAQELIARDGGGDPARIVSRCSREWVSSALEFRLRAQVS